MKTFIIMLLILSITSPLFSSEKNWQGNTHVFTDEDLEQYRYPSERRKSADDVRTSKDTADFKDSKKNADKGDQPLKRYEVSYKAYEGMARRIIIPVRFNDSVTAPMVLDTGATGMHISVALAEKLGLFEKDEGNLFEATSGIGGTIPAILTIIDTIQVDKLEEHFVPTKVSRSFSDEFEGLVGMDFIANFSIQIDTKKHMVVFEEHATNQRMPGGHDEDWWRTNFHQFVVRREEWKKLRREVFDLKDVSKTAMTVRTGRRIRRVTVGELRDFADRQYREADKLLRKLDGYAIDNAVPMEWREY